MTTVGRPPERCPEFISAKTCAAARPSLSAVSAVTGSMFAVPRTPSVPKIFLWAVMFGWGWNGLGVRDAFHACVGWLQAVHFQSFGHLRLDGTAQPLFITDIGEIYKSMNVAFLQPGKL